MGCGLPLQKCEMCSHQSRMWTRTFTHPSGVKKSFDLGTFGTPKVSYISPLIFRIYSDFPIWDFTRPNQFFRTNRTDMVSHSIRKNLEKEIAWTCREMWDISTTRRHHSNYRFNYCFNYYYCTTYYPRVNTWHTWQLRIHLPLRNKPAASLSPTIKLWLWSHSPAYVTCIQMSNDSPWRAGAQTRFMTCHVAQAAFVGARHWPIIGTRSWSVNYYSGPLSREVDR